MTPHENSPTIPIHSGALQGDTLSPFLFTIFMEPLLRWLSIGSRVYKPTHQQQTPSSTYMAYDDHGYAYDISITIGTMENLQIQIKKLHLFSKYIGLELETSKCEATGALWGYGNLMSMTNTNPFNKKISTIKFEDGTHIKYLPPNKSYIMLGVQINPMLDFRDHLKHITTEVRQLARVLTKRRLSPNRKQLVIDQLLKSKYNATHLAIFTDTQLNTIDKIPNKAARNALGLTPSLPYEAIHRPTKEMGLGYAPLRNMATQMKIEHLMDILNKPMLHAT
jgi:hypothetical protein